MDGPKRIVIVGAGGFGREVLDVIEAINRATVVPEWRFIGFVDDGVPDEELLRRRGAGLLGDTTRLGLLNAHYLVGIGAPDVRRRLAAKCDEAGFPAATIVHPRASVGSDVRFGAGTIVTSHVSVTTNIELGRHVHLNLNCTVGHDCVLGDFVTVNPGASISGNVVLEDEVTIGTGATVIQGKRIGKGTTVGAGAVVTADLPAGVVAVGVPARPRRETVT